MPLPALPKSRGLVLREDEAVPSNFSTTFARNGEHEGRYADFIAALREESVRALREESGRAGGFPENLSLRDRAALARAWAFTDELPQARELLRRLRPEIVAESAAHGAPLPLPLLEAQVLMLLAESALERRAGAQERALQLAQQATTLSAQLGDVSPLSADALFAEGLSLGELGYLFRSFDAFQRIDRMPGATPYRRSLAALNEAWLLWDLGRPEAARRIRDRVPPAFRFRIDLSLALLSADGEAVLQLFRRRHASRLPATEATFTLLLFVEATLVLPFHETQRASLRADILGELQALESRETAERSLLAARARAALEGRIDALRTFEDDRAQGWAWKTRARASLLRCLGLATAGAFDEAQAEYARLQIEVESHHLLSPLIPTLVDQLPHPPSPWAQRFTALLRLRHDATATRPPVRARLRLSSLHVLDGTQAHTLDLARKPMTQRLLTILAGPRGRRLSKSYLHEQLTACHYVPHLHDSRIHKLLRRFEKDCQEAGIPSLTSMPGDNSIVLLADIEVVE
jgi:hypothetical protein